MTQLSKLIKSVQDSSTRTDAVKKIECNSGIKLNKEYLKKALKNNKINMVIMGQDPYPSEATEFPILKENLHETLNTSIGERALELVISRLSINLPVIEGVLADSPFRIARYLLSKGVLLLNSKYWVVTSNDTLCNESRELNKYILEKVIKNSKKDPIDIHCFGEKATKTIAFVLQESQDKFYRKAKEAKGIKIEFHGKPLIIYLHSNK